MALHNGFQEQSPLIEKGLTDHETWGVRFPMENHGERRPNTPMKLQCEIEVCGVTALLNVATDANTFLNCKITDFGTQRSFSWDCSTVKQESHAGLDDG